jgi:hypothetical protein
VAEVGGIAGVVERGPWAQGVAGAPRRLVDYSCVAEIRWGRHYQVHSPRNVCEQLVQPAGITVAHVAECCLLSWKGVDKVGAGEFDPAGFQLDASRVAADRRGLHHGGADAAHGVGDQPAWGAVFGDQPAGQLGQHLAGVRAGGG